MLLKLYDDLLQVGGDVNRPDVIMQPTTDVNEWKLELERVLPQLKLTIRTDNKVRVCGCVHALMIKYVCSVPFQLFSKSEQILRNICLFAASIL